MIRAQVKPFNRRREPHRGRPHDRRHRIRRRGSTVVCVPLDERRCAPHGRGSADPHQAGGARKTDEPFRERVSSRDFAITEDARALYQMLLGPFRERLAGKSRLIVVPDGALWNVPFQALLSPDGYLIEAAAVSYAPSLTVLREIVQLPRPARPRTLLALAKSQFGPVSQSGLDPLPEAETQVRLIRDIYGPSRSVTYIGSEATESQFKAAAPTTPFCIWRRTACSTRPARCTRTLSCLPPVTTRETTGAWKPGRSCA